MLAPMTALLAALGFSPAPPVQLLAPDLPVKVVRQQEHFVEVIEYAVVDQKGESVVQFSVTLLDARGVAFEHGAIPIAPFEQPLLLIDEGPLPLPFDPLTGHLVTIDPQLVTEPATPMEATSTDPIEQACKLILIAAGLYPPPEKLRGQLQRLG